MFSDGEINKQCARLNLRVVLLQIRQHVSVALAIGQCSKTHYGVCEGRRASSGGGEDNGECFMEKRAINNVSVSFKNGYSCKTKHMSAL